MPQPNDPRTTIHARLVEAEEALSVAEGNAYRSFMLRVGIKIQFEQLEEAAQTARAESLAARETAELCEAELPEHEAQLAWYLPRQVEDLRRYRARRRSGIKPRYTEDGVRIIDFHDDWGLQRAIIRVSHRRARSATERRRCDALRAYALQLETSVATLRREFDEAGDEVQRLREIERVAQERYDAVKAEADALDASEPAPD